MIPCISQVTTLSTPFWADLDAYARVGWTHLELWMTKLEECLRSAPVVEVRQRLQDSGLRAIAASAQGGLFVDPRGAGSDSHWDQFERRLDTLATLQVPTLVIVPEFRATRAAEALGGMIEALGRAAERAHTRGVRLALEFQRDAPVCASLDTAAALVAQTAAPNLGLCLDLFHFYTGPSKAEDLAYLSTANVFLVQLSDLSGTPRELARDSDRIFPGDGDFQIDSMLSRLAAQGYDGPVSLELMNPGLWAIAADRVAEFGRRALERVLERADLLSANSGGL